MALNATVNLPVSAVSLRCILCKANIDEIRLEYTIRYFRPLGADEFSIASCQYSL